MIRAPRSVVAARHRVLIWRQEDGPQPLVLLHGFTGRAESFAPVVAHLVRRGAVMGINLPGHDPLTPADPAAGFTGAVDGLAAALAALGGGAFHIAGYSLGARLALGLLVRHPRLFDRATLIGVNPGLRSAAERAARGRQDAAWAALLRGPGLAAFLREWETQPLFATQRALPDEVRGAQRDLRRGHDPAQLATALDTLGLATAPDYWPSLPEVATPVRLVVGDQDEKFRAIARDAASALPRAELSVVAGAGHNVPLERPADLAALLRD